MEINLKDEMLSNLAMEHVNKIYHITNFLDPEFIFDVKQKFIQSLNDLYTWIENPEKRINITYPEIDFLLSCNFSFKKNKKIQRFIFNEEDKKYLLEFKQFLIKKMRDEKVQQLKEEYLSAIESMTS